MLCVLSAVTPPAGVNGSSLVHVINPVSGYTPTSIQVPFAVSPLFCGASLNLSFSPALPYLSIIGTAFTIDTQNPADFGQQLITITATTNADPGIAN